MRCLLRVTAQYIACKKKIQLFFCTENAWKKINKRTQQPHLYPCLTLNVCVWNWKTTLKKQEEFIWQSILMRLSQRIDLIYY